MSPAIHKDGESTPGSKFFYGWVIVGVCTLMLAVTYGIMYSYSVFFKPLAEHFNWDRATVSAVYSVSLVIRGAVSIGVGWLADKYGSVKLMIVCSILIGLGLVLSSQVNELWQFFITYALIEAIGLSGTFGIATALTSRWFTFNRGLALGIVSSGVGLGTLLIVPGTERLINAVSWSQAFIICGVAGGLIMFIASLFLRPEPGVVSPSSKITAKPVPTEAEYSRKVNFQQCELSLGEAIRTRSVQILITIFAFIIFCNQIVIVHLVNYATDMGITPLVAATFVSIIGIFSIAGRLTMGTGADKIGLFNSLIICCILLVVSFICLIFTRSLWAFYVAAVIFGFGYGGEVPQIPLFVGKFCGTKAMAALVGLVLFVGNIGGALGTWVAGKIFDTTLSYQWAFIAGIAAGMIALVLSLVLKKQSWETR